MFAVGECYQIVTFRVGSRRSRDLARLGIDADHARADGGRLVVDLYFD